MPFDEELAQRLREQLSGRVKVTERPMFGGKAFFVDGNLCAGVIREKLVARVGPERYADAIERPGVEPFRMTGYPMSGWVMVGRRGCPDDRALATWVAEALDYVRTLPKGPDPAGDQPAL